MNWEAIGAVGEVLGALAVFGSLLYLALQIKMFSITSKAQSEQQIIRDLNSAMDQINRDAESRETFIRGLVEGLDALNDAELYDFTVKLSSIINIYYAAQESGRKQLLSDDVPEGILNTVLFFIKTPGGRQWWEKSNWIFKGQGKEIAEGLETSDIPSLEEFMKSMRDRSDRA